MLSKAFSRMVVAPVSRRWLSTSVEVDWCVLPPTEAHCAFHAPACRCSPALQLAHTLPTCGFHDAGRGCAVRSRLTAAATSWHASALPSRSAAYVGASPCSRRSCCRVAHHLPLRHEQAATSRVADAPEIDWDYYASQLPEYNMAEIKVRLVGLRRCAVVCLATGRVSHILARSPPRSPSSTPS